MKLVRYGNPGKEKPGLIDDKGQLRDLSAIVKDIGPDQLGDAAIAKLRKTKLDKLPLVKGKPRLGSPVANVGKFIAIGLNYADHAAESGLPVPKEPVVFMKANSCIQGPNDPVMLPKGSVKTDWEVELGVVIGTQARYVSQKSTKTMIFTVAKIVSYVSQFMTLMPGDVITTGTPPGVGMGMKPPLFLKKGDVMTLGIEGLGEQRQEVIPFKL
jgi:2-keto-4-pentenoate hydratase/2-oxohepta-3-ene-1,7-dioic acid hydratase in catechol pathway